MIMTLGICSLFLYLFLSMNKLRNIKEINLNINIKHKIDYKEHLEF